MGTARPSKAIHTAIYAKGACPYTSTHRATDNRHTECVGLPSWSLVSKRARIACGVMHKLCLSQLGLEAQVGFFDILLKQSYKSVHIDSRKHARCDCQAGVCVQVRRHTSVLLTVFYFPAHTDRRTRPLTRPNLRVHGHCHLISTGSYDFIFGPRHYRATSTRGARHNSREPTNCAPNGARFRAAAQHEMLCPARAN